MKLHSLLILPVVIAVMCAAAPGGARGGAPGGVPKRDVTVPPEGMKLTLGDTTVDIVPTPGHITVMAECALASKLRNGAK